MCKFVGDIQIKRQSQFFDPAFNNYDRIEFKNHRGYSAISFDQRVKTSVNPSPITQNHKRCRYVEISKGWNIDLHLYPRWLG